MTLLMAEFDTPVGTLAVITDSGVVVASGFSGAADVLSRLTGGPAGSDSVVASLGDSGPQAVPASQLPNGIADAVAAYFAGDLDCLNSIPVRQTGTPLQEGVWQVLRMIPAGQTWSYGQMAAALGRPAAVRAVGQACGANLVAPFVPCHRAVRADGSLGGYAYGVETKQWLLEHEGAA